jgi:hypothetical protein
LRCRGNTRIFSLVNSAAVAGECHAVTVLYCLKQKPSCGTKRSKVNGLMAREIDRRSLLGASTAGAVLAAAGIFDVKTSASASVSRPDPVYFTWSETPTQMSLPRFAQELGYWDNAGIRPKFVGDINSGQLPALVGGGDITFASFMFNRALAAVAHGVDLKVIAAQSYTTRDEPHMTYFTRADSTITVNNCNCPGAGTVVQCRV